MGIRKRKKELRAQAEAAERAAQEAAARLHAARAEVEPAVKSRRYNHFTEMIIDSLLIGYDNKGGARQ